MQRHLSQFTYILGCVLTALLIFLLSAFALLRSLAPVVAQYDQQAAKFASQWLHTPVHIHELHLRWHGLVPVFVLHQAEIFAPDAQQPLLNVDEIGVGINLWQSLWQRHWRLQYLSVNGMQLTLQQTPDGRWHVAGLEKLSSPDAGTSWLDQIAQLHHVAFTRLTLMTLSNTGQRWVIQGSGNFILKISSADQWQLKGKIEQVGWQPTGKIPGVANLSGQLRVSPRKGSFISNSKNFAIVFPHLFPRPLFLNSVKGEIDWQRSNTGLQIQTQSLSVENRDIDALVKAQLRFTPGQSPWLDIKARYELNSSITDRLDDYLPRILNPHLIHWLTYAVKAVEQGNGTFILQGYAKDFPYTHAPGKFIIDTTLQNVTLHYALGWPSVKNLHGRLLFSGDQMQLQATSLNLLDIPLTDVNATIAALGKSSVLQVQSQMSIAAKSGQQFIQQSPLKNSVGKWLTGIDWMGPVQLALQLQVPLGPDAPLKTTQVHGQLQLQNNTLEFPAWQAGLRALNGQLQFDNDSIQSQPLTATLFGQPVTLTIATPQIRLQGKFVLAQLPPTLAQSLTPHLSGTLPYQAVITLPQQASDPTQLILTSTLQGTRVNFPVPLAKTTAGSTKNLQLTLNFSRQQLLRYGVNYNQLQLNAVKLAQKNAGWKLTFTHPWAAGQLTIPALPMQRGINGRLNYLYWQSSSANKTLDSVRPEKVPPLQITINDFHYNEKQFGQITLQTINTDNGMLIKTLRVTASADQITAQGRWLAVPNGATFSQLSGNMRSSSLLQTLAHWGLPADIDANNMQAQFNLRWQGPPYSPSMQTLTGTIHLQLGKGRIMANSSSARMDIGRLLSILSFQSLSRRLQLDFSDLTKAGLSFDYLKGDFRFGNGLATTNNLMLDGPVAQVTLTGNINLVQETYNLTVGVTPHVTSSLPIVATIAGGPIAGAVTFAADKLLNPVINKITTDTYSVTGPWNNPAMTRK